MRRLRNLLFLLIVMPLLISATQVALEPRPHWSQARTDSAGLAPPAATTHEAVIQVYAARLWGWRGLAAVHCWIAVKPEGAGSYRRFEMVAWASPRLRERTGVPDGHWAGNRPELLVDMRGADAARLIPRVLEAIAAYPEPDHYTTWPGPNSNSFIAYIGRSVPELRLHLPPTAVGKDFLIPGGLAGTAPSGGGFQVSLHGLAGFTLAPSEGIELNLLGFTLGADIGTPALKLPGIGRVGLPTDPERPLK